MSPPIAPPHLRAAPALAGAAALTLALYFIPQLESLARPLELLSTLVHELGHGLTALALGGELQRLAIWSDGSGQAEYSGAFGRLAFAATAAGGLLGPPLGALAMFLACRSARSARVALTAFTLLLLVALVLWVRNLFGLAFVASLCTLLGLLLWKGGRWAQLVTAFLAMQLALSAFSRSDYLFTSRAETAGGTAPSDTAQIAHALFLPFWFWGALIALLSLAIVVVGLMSAARAIR